MGESFEAKLIAASSKEVFKKAKQIVRGKGLLCCHEVSPGVLHAICRDPDGFVSHAELRGFPNGPFSGTCTCKREFPGFCPHALAAALYHAKYTIKQQEKEVIPDLPPQFAGLRFAGLPELLTQLLNEHPAHVSITVQDFPHVPSKWENIALNVKLILGNREFLGNLHNLRQLHFDKRVASLLLSQFPQQDQQIIRFLANNAAQDGSNLILTAEQCADFFHCLIGFRYFNRLGEGIVIHEEPAQPVLLLEKMQDSYLLRSAIMVKGSPLPLKDVKVISGQNGCWAGLMGEYWWLPARMDVAWLRNFLRTTVQLCDSEAAKIMLSAHDFPLKVIPSTGVTVKKRKFRAFYDGGIREDGTLEIELFFNYGNSLCAADSSRLASAAKSFFWMRNCEEEERYIAELVNFGFTEHSRKRGTVQSIVFTLSDREAAGMFFDEVIPRWNAEGRSFILSSKLAGLCSDDALLRLSAKLHDSGDDWFEIALRLTVGNDVIRWQDLTSSALRNESFLSTGFRGHPFVRIPAALRKLAASLEPVITYFPGADDEPTAEIIRIPRSAAYYWADAASELPGAVPVDFLRIKLDYDNVHEVPGEVELNPDLFTGSLRPYQKNGVAWLNAMTSRGCNVILADEMGLGKTVQMLAYLAASPETHLPALVICPTTLLSNWAAEIRRFLPRFRALVISGSNRDTLWNKAGLHEVVITSYSLAKRDQDQLCSREWATVILDEAQHIKNPHSQNSRMSRQIPSKHRIVLTGTPLENSAVDLWSIFDFLQPGLLGNLTSFRAKYSEIDRDASLKYELGRRIAPFMLRRRKADVCRELPPKQEQVLFCEMEPEQRRIYDEMEAHTLAECEALRRGQGKLTHMHILAAITRLRQICCDPSLLPDNEGAGLPSAKLELLMELLMETLDSGHKVLLFSQFTGMLQIICKSLENMGVPYEYMDGSTRDRAARIDHFNQDDEVKVFLLSLKAGGVGLNLTSADTVILYDPWWNPAAEAQATDRTHRIGQTRSVNCVRLAVHNSIEERVLALHDRKQRLFDALVEDSSEGLASLELDDLEFLLGKQVD